MNKNRTSNVYRGLPTAPEGPRTKCNSSKTTARRPQPWRTAFAKQNYAIIAVAVVLIVVGFTLMLPEVDVRAAPGGRYAAAPGPGAFDPVRIRVAPIPCFLGFALMVPAILYVHRERRKDDEKSNGSVKLH